MKIIVGFIAYTLNYIESYFKTVKFACRNKGVYWDLRQTFFTLEEDRIKYQKEEDLLVHKLLVNQTQNVSKE